eukprot:jgi/Mesvir1/17695/Mv07875-RA.1
MGKGISGQEAEDLPFSKSLTFEPGIEKGRLVPVGSAKSLNATAPPFSASPSATDPLGMFASPKVTGGGPTSAHSPGQHSSNSVAVHDSNMGPVAVNTSNATLASMLLQTPGDDGDLARVTAVSPHARPCEGQRSGSVSSRGPISLSVLPSSPVTVRHAAWGEGSDGGAEGVTSPYDELARMREEMMRTKAALEESMRAKEAAEAEAMELARALQAAESRMFDTPSQQRLWATSTPAPLAGAGVGTLRARPWAVKEGVRRKPPGAGASLPAASGANGVPTMGANGGQTTGGTEDDSDAGDAALRGATDEYCSACSCREALEQRDGCFPGDARTSGVRTLDYDPLSRSAASSSSSNNNNKNTGARSHSKSPVRTSASTRSLAFTSVRSRVRHVTATGAGDRGGRNKSPPSTCPNCGASVVGAGAAGRGTAMDSAQAGSGTISGDATATSTAPPESEIAQLPEATATSSMISAVLSRTSGVRDINSSGTAFYYHHKAGAEPRGIEGLGRPAATASPSSVAAQSAAPLGAPAGGSMRDDVGSPGAGAAGAEASTGETGGVGLGVSTDGGSRGSGGVDSPKATAVGSGLGGSSPASEAQGDGVTTGRCQEEGATGGLVSPGGSHSPYAQGSLLAAVKLSPKGVVISRGHRPSLDLGGRDSCEQQGPWDGVSGEGGTISLGHGEGAGAWGPVDPPLSPSFTGSASVFATGWSGWGEFLEEFSGGGGGFADGGSVGTDGGGGLRVAASPAVPVGGTGSEAQCPVKAVQGGGAGNEGADGSGRGARDAAAVSAPAGGVVSRPAGGAGDGLKVLEIKEGEGEASGFVGSDIRKTGPLGPGARTTGPELETRTRHVAFATPDPPAASPCVKWEDPLAEKDSPGAKGSRPVPTSPKEGGSVSPPSGDERSVSPLLEGEEAVHAHTDAHTDEHGHHAHGHPARPSPLMASKSMPSFSRMRSRSSSRNARAVVKAAAEAVARYQASLGPGMIHQGGADNPHGGAGGRGAIGNAGGGRGRTASRCSAAAGSWGKATATWSGYGKRQELAAWVSGPTMVAFEARLAKAAAKEAATKKEKRLKDERWLAEHRYAERQWIRHHLHGRPLNHLEEALSWKGQAKQWQSHAPPPPRHPRDLAVLHTRTRERIP